MTIMIMNWEWLTWPKLQAEYLSDCGHRVVIVDNCSTYQPLLDWYKDCPYEVISTQGVKLSTYNRFVFEMMLPERMTTDNYYAVTDSDIGFDGIPCDFAKVLIDDIERSPGIIKSGFSLRLDDLPDNPYAARYKESEKNNFNNVDSHGFFGIPIDTTFAVYSKDRCKNIRKFWHAPGEKAPTGDLAFLHERYFYLSHRSPAPYMSRHLPWYIDVDNLSDEQHYHISVTKHGSIAHFKHVYNL